MVNFVLDWLKNIVENGENAGHQHCTHNVFKSLSPLVLKSCGEDFSHNLVLMFKLFSD